MAAHTTTMTDHAVADEALWMFEQLQARIDQDHGWTLGERTDYQTGLDLLQDLVNRLATPFEMSAS